MACVVLQPDAEAIDVAARRLRGGKLVAFPTETVYGLGADAMNAAAVGAVFAMKGRPSTNPLIVHVDGVAMARDVVARWPGEADKLADAFWPGPLTLVLPKADGLPLAVTAGGETVAVRMPDHAVARSLLRAFGGPIVGPSANRSGYISPTTAEHVREGFEGEDLLVLDGGACHVGIESTVLLLGAEPTILRPGHVSEEDIERVIGVRPTLKAACSGAGDPSLSPGTSSSHYAPRTPTRLCHADEIRQYLREENPPACVVVISSIEAPRLHVVRRLPPEPSAYATAIFAALREADASGVSVILIEDPGGEPAWEAARDRLLRAAAGSV